ncbi:MAG TPA: class I SAM-dependent methyltransferase [Allosphingosinicella sp.]|jgi:ubiquinone/menaquinone biosynthesis C-methylase UbiE
MRSTDAAFSGSIPALYDRCLGPLLFEPYARDLAERVAAIAPRRILETAAGTGIVTAAVLREVPGAEIVVTDLNQAMLDVAAQRVRSPAVRFEAADAQALPFADGSFDLVLCQFGAMFFPDRVGAYREAGRVLKRGGLFLFNVWDSLAANPASEAAARAVAELFPEDPPSFLERVPFGYHDKARIEKDLAAAGFGEVTVETVAKRSRAADPREAAVGLCHGTPLRAEIEARDASRLGEAAEAAAAALARLAGDEGLDAPMSAHVVTARS